MRVSKRGNHLAVRLPQSLVRGLGLREGDEVELHVVDARTLAVSKAGDIAPPALLPTAPRNEQI
jgi:antitoxin component of MazEF toxin-antitoxin module